MLSESVARLRDAVNSVYTSKELEVVSPSYRRNESRTTLAASSVARKEKSISEDPDHSDGESSLSSITDGETDDPFDPRRRAKELDDIVAEGRRRLDHLERKLKTPQRFEAIKSLANWFEHRAPELSREIEELNRLERRHGDEQVEAISNAAAEATKELEDEMAHQVSQVDHFYHHLVDEMGGAGHLEKMEQSRKSMMVEYNKMTEESDDAQQLQAATDELQRLHERFKEISDPLHGLEAVDDEEQVHINGLKEAMATKRARLEDLQRVVDESGYSVSQLQQIMSAIKLENRGGLSSLEPSLQHLAAKLKEKARKGAETYLDKDLSVLSARSKVENEEGQTDKLEKQVKELELETKSRLSIIRIVVEEEALSGRRMSNSSSAEGDSSGDEEEEEENGEKFKLELVEALQRLREVKSKLVKAEANAHELKGKLARLEEAKTEVRGNFRRALEKLQQEDEESLLEAAGAGRPSPTTPSEWRRHLESSFTFAERDPELFARCMWLHPISDAGSDFIMGADVDSQSTDLRAGAEGGEAVFEDLKSGHRRLWQDLGSLEDALCIRRPPEALPQQASSGPERQDGAESCLQKLRDALAAEDVFQRGVLQELADESLFDAASLEWLGQSLGPVVAPAKRFSRPASRARSSHRLGMPSSRPTTPSRK